MSAIAATGQAPGTDALGQLLVGTQPTDIALVGVQGSRKQLEHAEATKHAQQILGADPVVAHMWACQFGIGIFEDRTQSGLNYNALIEVGPMVMAGRRCALLKDTTVPAMPTDLVGQTYKSVDIGDEPAVAAAVHSWAREDLQTGPCPVCQL